MREDNQNELKIRRKFIFVHSFRVCICRFFFLRYEFFFWFLFLFLSLSLFHHINSLYSSIIVLLVDEYKTTTTKNRKKTPETWGMDDGIYWMCVQNVFASATMHCQNKSFVWFYSFIALNKHFDKNEQRTAHTKNIQQQQQQQFRKKIDRIDW